MFISYALGLEASKDAYIPIFLVYSLLNDNGVRVGNSATSKNLHEYNVPTSNTLELLMGKHITRLNMSQFIHSFIHSFILDAFRCS
jgi:hypothetical protein